MSPAETLTAAADKLEGLLGNPLARAPMHSPVGRALVALLRSEARVCDSWDSVRTAAEARGLTVLVSGLSLDEALAVARAILGEASA